MSSTVNFGGACVVNGPAGGQPVEPLPRYVVDTAEDGTIYAYQKSATAKLRWKLRFEFLTSAQKSALETFYLVTAGGPTSTFVYTHTDGADYTARFFDTSLSWQRIMPNQWGVDVTLEVTSVPG